MKVWFLCFCLCLSMIEQAIAANRSCRAYERAEADQNLEALLDDDGLRKKITQHHAPFGFPKTLREDTHGEHILFHSGYIAGFDTDLLTPLWASYTLTGQDIRDAQGQPRISCFRPDPRFSGHLNAKKSDYQEPIFDQGHLVPDASLKHSVTQQLNTYVMTNIVPQYCAFNRGAWLSLENLERLFAEKYGKVVVTSAPVYDADDRPGRDHDDAAARMKSNNGEERIAVPSAFVKTFLRKDPDGWRSLTFLIDHTDQKNGSGWNDIRPFIVSSISTLAEVEKRLSLDLYPGLPMPVSESVEYWDLTTNRTNFEHSCR